MWTCWQCTLHKIYLSPDSPEVATPELAVSTESENATCVVPVIVEAAPELILQVE